MNAGRIAALVIALASSGCSDVASVSAETAEVVATARLKKVTHPKWGDVVWARLHIAGRARKLVSADINCFFLHVGDSESEELWVDSYVDIQRGDYPARDGVVDVAVYWPMKNFHAATNGELVKARLELRPKFAGSCFEFAKEPP
jgi:hypothetical protein